MMAGGRRRRRGALSEINVTPMVDVMLVLLIIFMVTAPALFQDLSVSLPKATVGQAEEGEGIIVTLTHDNQVQIDQERTSYADFSSRFAAARMRKPDRRVFLRADERVPYGKVIEAVGLMKAAGVEQVGLVVEIVNTSARPKKR